jgi:predicted ArsR family transcriptional regulator
VAVTSSAASPVRDAEAYRALAGRSRQALLAALRRAGRPLDASEAAAAVGLHRNTARVHLDLLWKAGLVRRRPEDRSIQGRPRMLYESTAPPADLVEAAGTAANEPGYRELAGLLAQQLTQVADLPGEAILAGRRWAAALDERPLPAGPLSAAAAAAEVTGVLSRLGFDPEQDLSSGQILLHRCPFADVARENRAVVCGIHLGMLTATAERLNSPLRIAGLDPFVTDDPPMCVVRLATSRSRRRRPDLEEAAP